LKDKKITNNSKSMEYLLRGDFLNDEKVSKIDSIKNNIDDNSVFHNNNTNNNSPNFNVNKIEIDEEQIDFIKNSLMNHFIFKDMSNDIM
jgi:hypothetical protein